MDPYLDVAGFALRTLMPSEDVDYLEERFPGFLAARLKINSRRIDIRLVKRCLVPFVAPIPESVLGWLAALTTVEGYDKRGWNPSSDDLNKRIVEAHNTALAELKEAADGEAGLFELPLRENTTESAVTRGGPLGYSEASPWDWTDRQVEAIRGR